jgi:tRNA(Arg) A34 adenosine deaminase TadA
MNTIEEALLRRAVALAYTAAGTGNQPFGAVAAAVDGTVLSEGGNTAATTGNASHHAELVAINEAAALGASLDGSVMYASGEPCPMCSAALVWAGVTRIVFAAAGPDFGPLLPPGVVFDLRCAEVVARSNREVEVLGPFLGEEALAPFRR